MGRHYLNRMSVRRPVCYCCNGMCNIRRFYRLGELYEADFFKPGIYGNGRIWSNAWDVFRRRRVEMVAVAGLLWISCCVLSGVDFFVIFFFLFCFSWNEHG